MDVFPIESSPRDMDVLRDLSGRMRRNDGAATPLSVRLRAMSDHPDSAMIEYIRRRRHGRCTPKSFPALVPMLCVEGETRGNGGTRDEDFRGRFAGGMTVSAKTLLRPLVFGPRTLCVAPRLCSRATPYTSPRLSHRIVVHVDVSLIS